MSLNLDKFKDELVGAWKEVMDEKVSTDWALFGYDGQTFDLKMVSKGDAGLDELVEDFSNARIMYGLCRVKLKEKNLEKIALINWQGEGAPLARKGTCANHVATIKSFFKGVHVTINARTDEDVSPDVIIEAVAKATCGEGIKLSSNFESQGKVEPIGSCYKRVNPQAEINSKAKDDFWKKEEQEEERRKREEQGKIRKFSQNEVKLLRRESQEYFNEQEEANKTLPNKVVSPSPVATNGSNGFTNGGPATPDAHSQANSLTSEETQSISPTPMFSNSYIASEKAAALKASIPKRNSASENLVRQRIKSFDGGSGSAPLVSPGGRNGSAPKIEQEPESLSVLGRKKLFENGGASNTNNKIVRRNPSEEISSLIQGQKPVEVEEKTIPPPVKSPIQRIPTPEQSEPSPSPTLEIPESKRTPSPLSPTVPISPIPAPSTKSYNLAFQVGGSVSGKLADTINKNSENAGTRFENGNGDKGMSPVEDYTVRSAENSVTPTPEPATIIPTKAGSGKASPMPPTEVAQEGKLSPVSADVGNGNGLELKPEMGLCARALYDYQAADNTEITFDPGEVITNIEKIDEGWWEGMGPQGEYGLFPANYVELLN